MTSRISDFFQKTSASGSNATSEIVNEKEIRTKRKSTGSQPQVLQDAIDYFVKADEVKTRGNVQLKCCLETITQHAECEGLHASHIVQLVDAAASGKFGERISDKLVKSLIPADVVPELAVVKAISWMCTNKPSTNLQCTLLRWILVIYDYMESHTSLHNLYTFLFYFMENDSLCPHVCNLLHRLTRLCDVKMFRVRALLQLQQQTGVQPHITGLLSLYKSYCPNLVAISLPRRKQTFFRNFDRVWSLKVKQVQDLQHPPPENLIGDGAIVPPTAEPASKRRRQDAIIPTDLTTVHNTQRKQSDCFLNILNNITSAKLPSQMGSVLRDRDLQYLLLCHKDPVAPVRLTYWLEHVLYHEVIEAPSACSPHVEELLASIVHLSDLLQEGIPICEDFLSHFLHTWNGKDYSPYIFKLLSRIRIHSYVDLTNLLEPIRILFFTSSVYTKELVSNYATVELDRLECTQKCQSIVGHSEVTGQRIPSPACYSVFVDKVEDELFGLDTLMELEDFAEALGALALQQEAHHVLLTHSVLSFCEQVSKVQSTRQLPFVSLPREVLVYNSLFSDNAMTLIRMVALINRLRGNFQELREMDSSSLSEAKQMLRKQGLTLAKVQNMYIMDFVNTLWLYKAFTSKNNKGVSSVYKLLPEAILTQLAEEKAGRALSLHEHQAFLPYAHHFLTLTQPAEAIGYPSAIKGARDTYMEYLGQEHLGTMSEFISVMVKRGSSHNSLSASNSTN